MKSDIAQKPRPLRMLGIAGGLLLLLVVFTGCPGPTVKVKAPCQTAAIIVSNISVKAHDTAGYTFFEYEFCLACPGSPPAPIAGVPGSITMPGVNPSQDFTTDSAGCVKGSFKKAVIDVGTGASFNGKSAKITIEGTDGKKELPGSLTIEGQ